MTVTRRSSDSIRAHPTERVRDRIVARLRARRLDGALAAGASPAISQPMAIRARKLVRAGNRRELAASLLRVAGDGCGHAALGIRMTGSASRVEEARPDLERLARRLADPDPVDARGVALTRALLSDGAGPLFWARSPENLEARLREAFAALEPRA